MKTKILTTILCSLIMAFMFVTQGYGQEPVPPRTVVGERVPPAYHNPKTVDETKASIDRLSKRVDKLVTSTGNIDKAVKDNSKAIKKLAGSHKAEANNLGDQSFKNTWIATTVPVFAIIVVGFIIIIILLKAINGVGKKVDDVPAKTAAMTKERGTINVAMQFRDGSMWIYTPPIVDNAYVSLKIVKEIFEASGEIVRERCDTSGEIYNASLGIAITCVRRSVDEKKALDKFQAAQQQVVDAAIGDGILRKK